MPIHAKVLQVPIGVTGKAIDPRRAGRFVQLRAVATDATRKPKAKIMCWRSEVE